MASISTLPTYEINSFARWVAEATERYFENPDVKRRFEEWKIEKESVSNEHINTAQQKSCSPQKTI